MNPKLSSAWANRAWAYNGKGIYEKALADINEAIRLQYDFAWAYFTRALIHKNMNNNDKMKSDIELCLEYTTDPKLIEAARALYGTP